MENENALLSAENLSVEIHKGNKTFRAVDSVNFSLGEGEICGLVGESGCGKSLTALSIAGLLPEIATAKGSIMWNPDKTKARDLLTLNEAELCGIRGREISMIFQEPISSLNPLMKIGKQISEALEIHTEKNGKKSDAGENRETVIAIMERLGLHNAGRLAGAYPWMLSGGMCQRVMIALAMICGPKLLIADEPTTALDIGTQEQIIELLKTVNKSGTAILFISHDLNVIRQLCGRVIVMYAGKILEEGSTREIFTEPAHEYTRSLLGALPENNVKGERLKVIAGRVPAVGEARNAGCPFFPRCGKAAESCKNEFPGEVRISETHTSRCPINGAGRVNA